MATLRFGSAPCRPAVAAPGPVASLSLALTGLNDGKGAFRRILAAPASPAVVLDVADTVRAAVFAGAAEVTGLVARAGGFTTAPAAGAGAVDFGPVLLSTLAFGTAGFSVSLVGLEFVDADVDDAAETERAMTAGAVLPFPVTPIGGGFIFAFADGFVVTGRVTGGRATFGGMAGFAGAAGAFVDDALDLAVVTVST